jgi:hypothetical protein
VTPLARILGLSLLLSASASAAEHDFPEPPRAKDAQARVALSVINRTGLVRAPFVTTAFPEVSGFGMVLTGGAAVRLTSADWLRATLPLGFVWLDLPARAQVEETVLGNLELGLEHRLELRAATHLNLLGMLIAPSAEHGPKDALLANRALAVGSALNGGRAAALLTPGVTGLRLGASVEHSWRPFELRASVDLPVLVRLSDASLPEDTVLHTLGILPALDLTAALWISTRFAVSLGGSLVTEPLRVQEPARERDRNRRLQPVAELGTHLRLGRHLALGLNANVPFAGALGGEAWSIGTRAQLGF